MGWKRRGCRGGQRNGGRFVGFFGRGLNRILLCWLCYSFFLHFGNGLLYRGGFPGGSGHWFWRWFRLGLFETTNAEDFCLLTSHFSSGSAWKAHEALARKRVGGEREEIPFKDGKGGVSKAEGLCGFKGPLCGEANRKRGGCDFD
jgi:hypothetical protein